MKRTNLLFGLILLFVGLGTAIAQNSNGYSYARAIVIDHHQVTNSDQTDFPVLISGTFPYLATVANGGNVQNANGYDVIFTSDAAGQSQLDHEIDTYTATSGAANFWVRIPTLSHTSDTTIYMWYGNSSITTSQENKAGVWRNGYAGVWHLGNGSSINANDSTGVNNGTVANVTELQSGEIGGAASFGYIYTSYISVPNSSSLKPTGAITLEGWVNSNDFYGGNDKIFSMDYAANGTWNAPWTAYALFSQLSGQFGFQVAVGGANTAVASTQTGSLNQWTHLVGTYDGGMLRIYINGSQDPATTAATGSISYGTSQGLAIGKDSIYSSSPVEPWSHLMDELRISSVARSSDWISTEYNNQTSASTFALICASGAAGSGPASCSLSTGPTSFNYYRPITIDHNKVAHTDQTDFPVLISGTLPDLATVANGGQVQNSNGYDIVFTSDAAGQEQLDHEIDNYSPTTGTAGFWVRIPTLSHTTDTTIYMWYGNSSVRSSQENKPGVWRNGYAAVWHMGNNGGYVTDSVNGNNGTPTRLAEQAGEIGGSESFNTTGSSYITVPNRPSIKPTSALTLEGWISSYAFPAPNYYNNNYTPIFSLDYAANDTWNPPFTAYQLVANTSAEVSFQIAGPGGTSYSVTGVQPLVPQQWSHVAGTYDGSTLHVYVNGAQDAKSTAATGAISYGTSQALTIGRTSIYDPSPGYEYGGQMDELRISSVARSADWIETEYNNQSSPTSFAYACPGVPVTQQPPTCSLQVLPSSFTYYRPVVISHQNVSNTDQTDFPVLISGTFPYLATPTNGGQVQNSNGYDILFTSDAAGQNQLDHEIDTYNSVTGAANFWVRIPTLSHTTDTTIYMWYGNKSVVSSQENKAGVWRNGFGAVWHLGNGTTVSGIDSTGANDAEVSNATAHAGQIGGSATVASENAYLAAPNSPSINPTSAITLEGWVNPTWLGNWNRVFCLDYNANGSWTAPYQAYELSSQQYSSNMAFYFTGPGRASESIISNHTIPLSQWTHVAATYDGSFARIYLNGAQDATPLAETGSIDYGTSKGLTIGMATVYDTGVGNEWDGLLDELRISTVARSADWIATEYNNQKTPGTFAVVGGSAYFDISTISLPAATQYISYSQPLAVSGGVAPYTWTITSGALPQGMTLNASTGVISGITTVTGTANFTVQATDTNLSTATRVLSLTTNAPPPLSITTSAVNWSIPNSSYNTNLAATGGVPPYSWSVASGAVPDGLTLSTSGTISGTTSSATGMSNFTVQAQDAIGNTTTQALSINLFRVDSVTPAWGAVNGRVQLNGAGFGPASYYGYRVTYANGHYTDTIPSGDTTMPVNVYGNGPISVSSHGATFSGIAFTLEGAPTITSLSPMGGTVGSTVKITGSGFGAAQSDSTVSFNGLNTTVTNWTDTEVDAVVPVNATTGTVAVTVADMTAQSAIFQVQSTVQMTDSAGNVTTYTFGMEGGTWHTAVSQGSGCSSCTVRGSNQYDYDNSGNMLDETDALSHKISYGYDGNNNLTSQTQALNGSTNQTWTYTYNSFGEVLTATDPLGNVTTNTYDTNGNLLTVTTPKPNANTAASVTQFAYNTLGELTTITDPLNHVTTLTYTPVGLISTITDAQNNVTTYGYDTHGNRTSVTDAMSHQTIFAYDTGDRLTTITYPDQTTTSFGYDYRGRRTSVTDQNGKQTTYAYDDADRLVSVTDAAQNVTQYAYDEEDNLLSITDANSHTTGFQYDPYGRVTETDFPSGHGETYVYDAVGNLVTKTDRNGNSITYAYDALNRLAHKGYPDSTGVNYGYDLVGKILQASDPTGAYGFAYDNMGRLTGTTTQYMFLPNNTYTNSYGYDATSNRIGFTAPDGSTNTYAYDSLNRLSSLTNSSTGQFGFGYDALSRRTSLTRPNAVNTSYSYDSLSRLLSILHQSGGATIDGATYTLDNAGNRMSKLNWQNGITENYTYDPIYELTQVQQVVSGNQNTTESYSYDAVGNRQSSLNVSSYSYNNSNELTSSSDGYSYTYDYNGNTLTKANSSGTTQYVWDFENRLTSVTLPNGGGSVNFKYDPFGRRTQKAGPSGTTNYLYDGGNLIEEADNSGNVVASYAQAPGIDQPLSESRSGVANYYDADGLDSITSLANASGSIASSYTYDSFGNLAGTTGSVINPFRYTSREFDAETGLRFYRTRYYDPNDARFIGEDLARFAGGMNFYRYVGNSPTRFFDPFGLGPVNAQDMASLNALFPGSTPLGGTGLIVPLPCDQVRKILEQNGFYTSENWSSWNPVLFWDPIAHSGGWEFRKKDGMHIRMKYPKPCDKNCNLDEAHNDDYNPMFDPWGHFTHELVPYLIQSYTDWAIENF